MNETALGAVGGRHRRVTAAAALIFLIAASRVLAMPRTFWEWDDYIFGLALHIFAPQSYVPQPPFFPAFIGAARFVRIFLRDDVGALSAVSVVSNLAACALLYGIVRETIGDRRVAAGAAVLFAFFPASWFFAGTPLSDMAGVACALAIVWLCALSRRKPAALLAAGVAAGVAIGVRPQTAAIAFLPFAAAAWKSRGRWRAVAAAILCTGVFWALPVVVAAGGVRPVLHPFFAQWKHTVGETSPLATHSAAIFVLRRWLVDPWGVPAYAAAAWIGIGVGAVALRRGRSDAVFRAFAGGTLLYALAAILFLDLATTGRYAVAAMPAAAVAAAAGLAAIEDRVGIAAGALTGVFVAASAIVVGPALVVIHTRASPPVEAAHRVRTASGGARVAVVYPASMEVPARLLFPDVPTFEREKTPDALLAASPAPVWRFGVGSPEDETAVVWPTKTVFSTIGMGRYLRVAWGRWRERTAEFRDGWFPEERDGDEAFRWMGRRADIVLPPERTDQTVRFELVTPMRRFRTPPDLVIRWNGSEIDRRPIRNDRTDLSCRLDRGAGDRSGILRLESTQTFHPRDFGSTDPRELSFEMRHFRRDVVRDNR